MDPAAEEEVVMLEPPSNKFQDIYRFLAAGAFPPCFCAIKRKNLKRYAQKFILEGGCLYYVGSKKDEKREVVVDPERRQQVILESHFTELGHHLGQKKTVHRIQSRYYWLGIVKDVIDWIKMCETCQNAEHSKNISRKCKPVKADSPWEVLGLDLHGPFLETTQENAYVLTVTDYFTKWIEALPLQKKDALSVAKGLASVFYRFGASKHIYFNESWDFCDEVSRHLCEKWNISQAVTPAIGSSGLDDRSSQLLKTSIRSVVAEKQRDWDNFLDPILFEFRTSVNPITKYTPFFLMYNREAQLSSEAEFTKDYKDQNAGSLKHYVLPPYTVGIQEQQSAIKETVIANMRAVYKQERKSIKRKIRSLHPLHLKDKPFGNAANAPLQKFEKGHVLSMASAEQTS